MGKAVIIGSGVNALGVIHDCVGAGLAVICISTEKSDPASFSRHILKRIKAVSPLDDNENLLKILDANKKDWEGALLIPTDDASAVFVSKNREALPREYIPASAGWDIIEPFIQKNLLYQKAVRLGIPTPKIHYPITLKRLIALGKAMKFPCILKPCQKSRFFVIYGKKVLKAKTADELVRMYSDTQKHGLDMMVSEIIPGPESNIYTYRSYRSADGQILAEMCTQKLRQYPHDFGDGCVVKTIAMNEQIKIPTLKILESSGFTGYSSAEFKFDPRDNQFKLIEINVRPVSCQRLLTRSGINFTLMTYLDLVKNKPFNPTYQKDFYFIHVFFDAWEFLRRLSAKKIRFRDFLHPYLQQNKTYAFPLISDPLPFLVAAWKNSKTAVQNLLATHII